MRQAWVQDLRETLELSVPLCAAYAGNKLMGLVDLAIVGRLTAVDIAGASLGNALFFLVTILGVGTLMGLDPLVAQAVGAQKPRLARWHYRNGLWLSVLLCLPLAGLLFAVWGLLLPAIGIAAPIQATTLEYLLGRSPSILFYFFFITMRCYLQSVALTRPIILATVVANLVNIPASVFLALGDRGLESVGLAGVGFGGWGVLGAALGTSIVTLVQMLYLAWSIHRLQPEQDAPEEEALPGRKEGLKRVFFMGYPTALQFLAEGGMFGAVTLLMGRFGEDLLGGHQVALQIASFSFTICLGLSSATCVRVGHATGRRDPDAARRAGFTGIGLSAIFMSCSALVMWFGASFLAHAFAKPPGVIEAAIGFLGIAALFQLVDGIQVVASGALRGTGNTRLPFVLNVISHWCFGMPTAVLLGFWLGFGGIGLWWGLTTGLLVGSTLLTYSFGRQAQRMQREPQPR